MAGPLADKSVLIVEDEYFIAVMAAEMVDEIGARAVGPAATVAEALKLVESERVDVALLDVNLKGERSDAVARRCAKDGVPVVFVTGYGAAGWSGDPAAIVLDKPYTRDTLKSSLEKALARA